MNKIEMQRRLNSMTPELIQEVSDKLMEGNGENTIFIETDATRAQIHAVAESMGR
jgi:hypothetical protein